MYERRDEGDPFSRAPMTPTPVVQLRLLPDTNVAPAKPSDPFEELSQDAAARQAPLTGPQSAMSGLFIDDDFWADEPANRGWAVPLGVVTVMIALGVVAVAGLLAVVSSVSAATGGDAELPVAAETDFSEFGTAQLQRRSFPPLSGVLRSDVSISVAMRGYLHADGVVCAEVRVADSIVDSMCAPAPDRDKVVSSGNRTFPVGDGQTVDGMIRVSAATTPHVVAFTLGNQTDQHQFCPGSPTTVWLEPGQTLDCSGDAPVAITN